jgi:predicted dehydrogenase
MKKTRIAVAGAGYIGQAHMDAAIASSTVQLSAIVDPSPNAIATAKKYGIPLYTSLAELFAKDKPDGIVLATPNQLHLAHAKECMEVNVPMLLEKPITVTVSEAEELVTYQQATKATILIGHHRAHSPIMAKAREIVDSGKLGKLVAVRSSSNLIIILMTARGDAKSAQVRFCST